MGPGLVIVIAVIGFTLVGLVAYGSYLSAKKRREEFSALATQRGWSYVDRDDSWAERFEGAPFGQGHSRHADNVLQGVHDGRSLVAFDYRYSTTETTSGPNGTTTTREQVHPFSIVALSTGAVLPALSVTPENVFGRIL